MTDLPWVICGQGRLGGRIAAILAATGNSPQPLRLVRGSGLQLPPLKLPVTIGTLILCLVPRDGQSPQADGQPQRASSGWAGLLDGLLAQVQRGELQIQQLVQVSSTAVYEDCVGWVSADTPTAGHSERALALIEAEQRVRQIAANSLVVRLTGLYGPGYERYQPQAMSHDKPRMGVDVRAAAAVIARLARQEGTGPRTALVTDGQIYHQGQLFAADPALPPLAALAKRERLLLPSHAASWPPTKP
ncbi:MAG: hypothetical protein II007_15545 [Gammaproteobacteria bacterium]|nr:hypothetical protein [Gammaproteobacteria bacterium]